MSQSIHRIKVTLRHSRPPIWRRLEVPSDMSLKELHDTLQVAMGWDDSHLHHFIHAGATYGPPDPMGFTNVRSERRTQLRDLLDSPRQSLLYEYDFGDGWEHDVVLEAVENAVPGVAYPRVTAGERACPPEDVGGIPGYEYLLEKLASPGRHHDEELLMWVDEHFDPARYDVQAVNDRLWRRLARTRGTAAGRDYSPPVARLMSLGEPDWNPEEWPDYLELGLTAEHVPELLGVVAGAETPYSPDDAEDVDWAGVHAWRALAQLGAVHAVLPLLEILDEVDGDDWMFTELPRVFSVIGAGALPELASFLQDSRWLPETRATAVDAMVAIATNEPDRRGEVITPLALQLALFRENGPFLNAFIITRLVDLRAMETVPLMEQAFDHNAVDLSFNGDWEEIQIQLGLLTERITPRPGRWDSHPATPLRPIPQSDEGNQRGRKREQKARRKSRQKTAHAARVRNRRRRK